MSLVMIFIYENEIKNTVFVLARKYYKVYLFFHLVLQDLIVRRFVRTSRLSDVKRYHFVFVRYELRYLGNGSNVISHYVY